MTAILVPLYQLYAEYNVSDRSWRLISGPASYEFLADYLAQQIVATLRELYRV